MVGIALLVFPKLALGLSGFETGVAVMPQVRGDAGDTEAAPGRADPRHPAGCSPPPRVIMSVFLITSSLVTTCSSRRRRSQPAAPANGRALAYLAHEYLGDVFGTVYDLSTIAILWFAGASAMAGLLNLVPRYLPRYGMAPAWARAVRPLVLVFTAIAFLVTVALPRRRRRPGRRVRDRRAGADHLGRGRRDPVRAAPAGQRGDRSPSRVIAAGLRLHDVANVVERPDGVKIAACFIAGIMVVSLLSRLDRAFELRVDRRRAGRRRPQRFLRDCGPPHDPADRQRARQRATRASTATRSRQILADNDLPDDQPT